MLLPELQAFVDALLRQEIVSVLPPRRDAFSRPADRLDDAWLTHTLRQQPDDLVAIETVAGGDFIDERADVRAGEVERPIGRAARCRQRGRRSHADHGSTEGGVDPTEANTRCQHDQ